MSLTFALYSDDSSVRKALISAMGERLSGDLPTHQVKEFATGAALRASVDSGLKYDLFILDGEAVPEGGMGIARALKDEVFQCPPVLLIIARAADAWLAGWSRADAVISHPVDPFTVASEIATVLRTTRGVLS
jgi:DNA-binding response OmpR family regulator